MKFSRECLLLASLVVGLWTHSPAEAQETVVLRFNRWVPPNHPLHTRIIVPWAERVESATSGRVKITFPPASLGTPARQFDLAATGVADLVVGNQTFTPERFLLSRVAELPFMGDTAEAISVAHWRVQKAYFDNTLNEYKGTKLLAVFGLAPIQIFTARKQVNVVADLAGLKIRAPAGIGTRVSEALGVVPIGAPPTEAYDMMSRGIVDGTFTSSDTVKSFQIGKFLKFQTKVPKGLYNAAFFVVMNEAKWNALSADDKAAVEKVSGEAMARHAGRVWDDEVSTADDVLRREGMTITTATPGMYQELHSKLDPLAEEWIKEAQARGVDARAALAAFRKIAAEYKPGP